MLSEVCKYLNNWFDCARLYGTFTINEGNLDGFEEVLQTGQYFRIYGSVFNDGVYKYPQTQLRDETFNGTIWIMKVPPQVIELSDLIDEWEAKYIAADSAALSPFNSESFGGYSYSKGSGGENGSGGDWESIRGFISKLNQWRKPRCRY